MEKLETTRSLGGQGLTNLRQEITFGGLGLIQTTPVFQVFALNFVNCLLGYEQSFVPLSDSRELEKRTSERAQISPKSRAALKRDARVERLVTHVTS